LGAGPGEVEALTDIFLAHDSLFVLDALSRRLLAFHDGRSVGTWIIRDTRDIPERILVRADGSVVVAFATPATEARAESTTVVRGRIRFRLARRHGSELMWVDLFNVAGKEQFSIRTDEGVLHGLPAFWTTTSYDLFETGVATADGRTGSLEIRDWNGQVRGLASPWATAPRQVTDEELKAMRVRVDIVARRRPDIQYREYAEAALTVWGSKPPRPFVEGLVSDGASVAVQLYEYADAKPQTWLVFDARSGRWRGEFILPPTTRVLSYRQGIVAVVARDSLDVESVVLLRMPTR
jgi:hypothetical protein